MKQIFIWKMLQLSCVCVLSLLIHTTSLVDSMANTKERIKILRFGRREVNRTGIARLNSINSSLNCCGWELLYSLLRPSNNPTINPHKKEKEIYQYRPQWFHRIFTKYKILFQWRRHDKRVIVWILPPKSGKNSLEYKSDLPLMRLRKNNRSNWK